MKRKIVFFGAGKNGQEAVRKIRQCPELFSDEYIGFCDNNSSLCGTKCGDLQVMAPQELTELCCDLIVICSIYEKEIRAQLVSLGVLDGAIINFTDYVRMLHCEWQYKKRYSQKTSGTSVFHTDSLVVYTAIMGNYDTLHEPLFTYSDITYICFTNNREFSSGVWNIVYVRDESLDDMHLAKQYKVLPHLYLSEFDTSVWVDGKFQIVGDLRQYIAKYGRTNPMLCFPHHEKYCVYEEAGTCLHYHLGEKERIINQIVSYANEGYPYDNGLYELGCIVRKHNDKAVISLMEQWREEIWRYSYRDQLSFPVVCWRNQYMPDISAENVFRNEWLKTYEHIDIRR